MPDLIGRLRLDTRDLDRAKGEVNRFAKDVEGSGGRIRAGLGSGLDDLTTSLTAGLGTAGASAKATLDRIGTSAIASGSALQFGLGAGAVAGGLLLTKFATDGVSAFLSLADEVRGFQRASGASAEDSSRFVAVLDDLEISSEAGASAMFKLGREVAGGAPRLREFGIEVARNADGTSNLTETLLNVADAYSRAPDQAARTAIAFAAFGKSAQNLVPLLEKGRTGLAEFFAEAEKHGQLMSEEDLAQAKELRLAIDEMNDALRGLQLIGAKALVPFITTVSDAAAKTFGFLEGIERRTGGLLSSVVKGIGQATLRSTGPIGQGLADLKRLTDGTNKTEAASREAAPAVDALGSSFSRTSAAAVSGLPGIEGWGDRASRVADQLKAIAQSQDRRRTATLSVVDAEQANNRATTSFADAVARVADIERDLTRARTDRTAAASAAIAAERALHNAESAQSNVIDAERDLERARAGRGQRARQLADAEKALRDAQDAVASAKGMKALKEAQEGLAEAEQRVADARAEGGREEDIRSATKALTSAQLDAKSAALELAEAREESARRQVRAEADVTAARQAATDAALSAARAAQELAERQAEASGQPFTVSDGYNVFRDTLIDLKDRLAPGSELRRNLEGLIDKVGALPAPAPIDVTFAADTTPIVLALERTRGEARRAVDEVRILGASAFLPLGASADDAKAKVVGINASIGVIRSSAAQPFRFSADVEPITTALTGVQNMVDRMRADTGNLLAGITVPTTPLLAPSGAAATRPGVASVTTEPKAASVTNNVTVNALGANEDVARTINERLARDAARAR